MERPAKRQKTQASPARNYCFTNYDVKQDWESVVNDENHSVHYVGYSIETCPKTKKKHQQGFFQLKKKMRITGIVKQKGMGAMHMEVMRGSYEENKKYCSKEGEFKEHGVFVVKGQRTQLMLAIDDVKAGMSTKNLWLTHSVQMVKFHKGLNMLKDVLGRNEDKANYTLEEFKWDPITDWSTSHILWGKSGIGKTQFALAHFEHPLLVSHIDDLRNFDKEVNDGIIFDDMDFLQRPRSGQIHLVDQDHDRAIHLRYANFTIPKNTKKIFTTNIDEGGIMNTWEDAIKRRTTITELRGQVWGEK